MTDGLMAHLREAFDGNDVPAKNIALRKAFDALEAKDARIAELAKIGRMADEHAAMMLNKRDARIAALEAENKELEAVFETKWDAEQRAIKAWQKKTGKDMTWPDHAQMVEWLLDELDAARAAMEGKE